MWVEVESGIQNFMTTRVQISSWSGFRVLIKKIKNFTAENKNLALGLHERRSSNKRSLQPPKENIRHIKTWNFCTFLFLWVIFALLDPDLSDPDPIHNTGRIIDEFQFLVASPIFASWLLIWKYDNLRYSMYRYGTSYWYFFCSTVILQNRGISQPPAPFLYSMKKKKNSSIEKLSIQRHAPSCIIKISVAVFFKRENTIL